MGKVSRFRLVLNSHPAPKKYPFYTVFAILGASCFILNFRFVLLPPKTAAPNTESNFASPFLASFSNPTRQWIPCIKSFTSTSDTKSQSTVAIRTESQAGDCLSVSNYLRALLPDHEHPIHAASK